MKSIDEMSGVEKAAALLVAMGRETAVEVIKNLDDDSVMRISSEVAKIEKMSAEARDDLIGEFLVTLKKMKNRSFGGEDFARKILREAFGDEKASDILQKVKHLPDGGYFDFLDDVEPQIIVDLISTEHPQMIAVMIAHIDRTKAGAVMKILNKDTAKEVALRLAKMGKVSPDVIMQMSVQLKKKYDNLSDNKKAEVPGGLNALAGIFKHLNSDAEKRIMDHFDSEIPVFADEIRRKITIFDFETIANLTNREIRLILGKVAENRTIAKALKGAGDDLKYRIMRNISANKRGSDIVSLMDLMGPVRMSEVNEARSYIVSIMRDLNEKGAIIIRKQGEDIVG